MLVLHFNIIDFKQFYRISKSTNNVAKLEDCSPTNFADKNSLNSISGVSPHSLIYANVFIYCFVGLF
jgi:hypothetical protein